MADARLEDPRGQDHALAALVPDITAMALAPLALTCSILIVVTALATALPVYRVSTIDPVQALRAE